MPDVTRLSRLLAFSFVTLSATSAFAAGPNVLKNARHDTSLTLAQLTAGAGAPSRRIGKWPSPVPRVTRLETGVLMRWPLPSRDRSMESQR